MFLFLSLISLPEMEEGNSSLSSDSGTHLNSMCLFFSDFFQL
ncbi:hypothetical protein LEP1GSC083_2137 [Leptospira interrogans serovar Pyrogenes str. L0374]|uniref:Uncharacterized protein n=3 Tax=Leptospira interrogans TaxID=173 RepID=M6ZY80_LEPIR|nr:hypothetical protein LEP1GSC150_3750 [Leptospira interrogans serovar Copenhageni str. LT2050]EMN31096.1 hypothetical protein LEP1GSC083_2137 [Leptospira interrogans serovar Pyrogenes str. L0374]EMP09267.1 hypothetical protein LEP1GSC124_0927 [Leptospira interrogans serovar Pyrogenes str. 200701872]